MESEEEMDNVNWDFAVNRWANTMSRINYTAGGEEVDKRCANLPPKFRQRLIATLKGKENSGRFD